MAFLRMQEGCVITASADVCFASRVDLLLVCVQRMYVVIVFYMQHFYLSRFLVIATGLLLRMKMR